MMDDYITNPKPTDPEMIERADQAQKLYAEFLNLDTDQILDRYPEITIRDAALIAGTVYVDERNPKRITAAFVEEVKAAMRKTYPSS